MSYLFLPFSPSKTLLTPVVMRTITSSLFPFAALPPELRRQVYQHVSQEDVDTLRSGTLTCREFFEFFFPLLHESLLLEAEYHDSPVVGFVGAPSQSLTFAKLMRTMAQHTLLLPCVRNLVLSGPSPPMRMKCALTGVMLEDPLLSCCDISALLNQCQAIHTLTLRNTIWTGCRTLANSCCLETIPR